MRFLTPRLFVLAAFAAFAPDPATAQESKAIFDAPLVVAGPTRRFEVIADLDGDGDKDLVSAWWDDSAFDSLSIELWYNNGSGAFTQIHGFYAPLTGTTATISSAFEGGAIDVNGDSYEDFWIAVHGVSKTQVFVYESNGDALPTLHPLLSMLVNPASPPAFA